MNTSGTILSLNINKDDYNKENASATSNLRTLVDREFEFLPLLEREAVVFQVGLSSVHIYKMQAISKYLLPIQYTDWENDRDGYYYRKIYSGMLGGKFGIS